MPTKKTAATADIARFTFHHGQTLAYRAMFTHRIVSVLAGTGSGKTWSGPRLMYKAIYERPDATFVFLEPTYKMLRRVMLPAVLSFFDGLGLGEFKKADMIYELRTGGRIIFGSVDNPNSIQGVHADGGIWADEIGLYTEEAWDVILQRSAFYKCPVLNTSTPYTLPWVERRLAKPARDPSTAGEYWIVQFPSYWNPSYPLDQFFALKRQWPRDKFERLLLGLFVPITGLMFDFEESYHGAWIEPLDGMRLLFRHPVEGERIVELVRCWMAQDWGWKDPACQLLFGEDALGRIYVFDEDYESGIPVERGTLEGRDTWINRALAQQAQWNIEAIYCDPSMPGNIADMVAHGLNAIKATNKIDFGTDMVNEQFNATGDGSYGLYIALNRCPNLLRTIGSYVKQRAPDGEGFLPIPVPHQEDHAPDTLRYGIARDATPQSISSGVPLLITGARRRS